MEQNLNSLITSQIGIVVITTTSGYSAQYSTGARFQQGLGPSKFTMTVIKMKELGTIGS